MKSARALILSALFAVCAVAQTITAPPQPISGPGSDQYLYGAVQNGPYNAQPQLQNTSYNYYIFTPVGLTPSPSNPNPLPTPASAPVVLFIHGYDGDTLDPYYFWMLHMTQMGNTVVWILYDTGAAFTFDKIIIKDYQAALKTLATPGLVPPSVGPKGSPITFIVGHSSGAYLSYKIAAEGAANNLPVPLGVLAVEPGQGKIPVVDPSTINANTVVVTVVGDQDKTDRICDGVTVWTGLSQTSPFYKPFLLMRSDSHGTPAQLGNHWFPLTETAKDTVPPPVTVDDRDWNVTYKMSVAMIQCLTAANYCDYLYGNGPVNSYGATTQTDMGVWSDGTPVLPMIEVSDPTHYFGTCPSPTAQ